MNRFVYILFFLLFSLPLSAQTDYLDPVRSLSNYKGELGEYYRNVIWLLNTGFQEKPYARYVVLPSFSNMLCRWKNATDAVCWYPIHCLVPTGRLTRKM